MTRSSPPACAFSKLARRSVEPRVDLGLVHRLEKPVERGLARRADAGTARAADRGPASASPRRPTCGPSAAPRTPAAMRAHLDAPRMQPLESLPRVERKSGEHLEERGRGGGRRLSGQRRALGRVHLGVDRGAERGIETSPVRYASSPATTSGRRMGPSGVRAAAVAVPPKSEQVPPEKERFADVVRHARLSGRARRLCRRLRFAQSSPARVEASSLSMMSRMSKQRSTNSGSRCISFGGRCGAGTRHLPEDRPGRGGEDVDAVAEIHGLLDGVRDEEDRRLRLTPEIHEQRLHVQACRRIERAERLVHQDDPRRQNQRARDRDALAHAARQLAAGTSSRRDRRRGRPWRSTRGPARAAPSPPRRGTRARTRRCPRPCGCRTTCSPGTPCCGRSPAPRPACRRRAPCLPSPDDAAAGRR